MQLAPYQAHLDLYNTTKSRYTVTISIRTINEPTSKKSTTSTLTLNIFSSARHADPAANSLQRVLRDNRPVTHGSSRRS
jgi:hypothetical protein